MSCPQVIQELHVPGDFFLGAAFGGGARDEAAHRSGTLALQNAFQPEAFFVAGDLARNAHMFERGHVDHEASRQGDMRGDARALLSQGLLGDLNDDLLTFFQKVGDRNLLHLRG